MTHIHTMHSIALAAAAEAENAPEEIADALWDAQGGMRMAILRSRAQSRADLDIKIGIWTDHIEDPMYIQPGHKELWKILLADFAAFMDQPELEAAA